MLSVFKAEFGVTKGRVEEYVGRPAGTYGNEDIILLQGVYKAIKDGQATVESYFPKTEVVDEPLGVPELNEKDVSEGAK